MAESTSVSTALITTSLVAFFSGFALGIYSIRGYVLPPSLAAARRQLLNDPVESEEEDVEEDDTILDHAPNWANGAEADRRQGLRVPEAKAVDDEVGSRKGGEKKIKKRRKAAENKTEPEPEGDDAGGRSARGEAEAAYPRQTAVNPGSNPHECKLVLVVRTDLGMTKGKIAAQCSHATLACYKTLSRTASSSADAARVLQRWERLGQAKIAVQVKSQEELLALMGRARGLGITAEVIQDAGRTQIDPGSLTVLGVGPAPKSLVDQITGGLKLL
ncbi:PTH2-domain-containing protein [Nemania serpens]|nr:PTH2-domain-containing protein [Nemania serpens]